MKASSAPWENFYLEHGRQQQKSLLQCSQSSERNRKPHDTSSSNGKQTLGRCQRVLSSQMMRCHHQWRPKLPLHIKLMPLCQKNQKGSTISARHELTLLGGMQSHNRNSEYIDSSTFNSISITHRALRLTMSRAVTQPMRLFLEQFKSWIASGSQWRSRLWIMEISSMSSMVCGSQTATWDMTTTKRLLVVAKFFSPFLPWPKTSVSLYVISFLFYMSI